MPDNARHKFRPALRSPPSHFLSRSCIHTPAVQRKHALNHAAIRRSDAWPPAISPGVSRRSRISRKDAINAVYDLCEDQDSNVHRVDNTPFRQLTLLILFYRYESGYKAIVRMSEEQPRWLERNVDVLVQLLQSSLQTNRRRSRWSRLALIQHLELDFKVTLGIFCDQIEPPDNPMKEEDKTICERLRALVVAFLAQDVRSPLLAQLQGQGRGAAEQEDALIDRYPYQGSIQIFRGGRGEDILLLLPSFNDGQPRRRGNELVHLLLARGDSALREDLAPGRNPASLEQYPPSPVKSGSSESDLVRLLSSPHAALVGAGK
ncbi:hypothetical protein EDB87DRAFT_339361 [Lactarius vividus]|nr:hypothetical protein EDB87DRAFT_339361 [Lactarius vividus]